MLALWMYFWEETPDWDGVTPTPTPTPTGESDAGGGGKKRYDAAGSDFWEVRERYLRRYVEPVVKQHEEKVSGEQTTPELMGIVHTVNGGAVILMQQAMDAAVNRARNSTNIEDLRDAAARSIALAIDISNLKQQYYNRAIALLLLDIF